VSQLELERVSSPRLRNLSVSFGPGIHVLLGAESDGTADVIELCAGVRLPERGQLKLDGQMPASSPQTRRRIASLLALEGWAGEGDVQHWIGHLGALNELEVLGTLGGVEMALVEAGVPIELGAGVAAAQRSFVARRQAVATPVAATSR